MKKTLLYKVVVQSNAIVFYFKYLLFNNYSILILNSTFTTLYTIVINICTLEQYNVFASQSTVENQRDGIASISVQTYYPLIDLDDFFSFPI